MSKKLKKSKKVVYSDDSEEPYNSEEDYAPDSETASDIETEETEEESDEKTDNEESSGSNYDDSSQSGGQSEEDAEEEIEDVGEEESDEEESEEEESEEEIEEEDEVEAEVEAEADEEFEGNEEWVGESKSTGMKNLDKDFLVLDEDDSHIYGKMEYKKVPDEDRISDNILTYYEIVRIIGTRAQQFNYGAIPLVKNLGNMHPAKMAYVELRLKMTPFIICRNLPGKKYEEWKISELEQIHEITDDFFVPENVDWLKLMEQANKTNKKSSKKNK